MKEILLILTACMLIRPQLTAQDEQTSVPNSRVTFEDIARLEVMDWPLTAFRGQLRISGSVLQQVARSRVDRMGNRISLSAEGTTYAGSGLLLDIEYGITNYLQAGASIRQDKYSIRRTSALNLFFNRTPEYYSYALERSGIGDLDLSLDFKWPPVTQNYDIRVSAGMGLPTGKNGELMPAHEAFYNEEQEYDEIKLLFREGNGWGTITWRAGGEAKYRFKPLAVRAGYSVIIPFEPSEVSQWSSTRNGYNFQYTESTYSRLEPNMHLINGSVEYQFKPFFSVEAGYEGMFTRGGYTQIGTGISDIPPGTAGYAVIGYNLIATTSLWIRQRVGIFAHGENTYAPVSLEADIIYNIFR